jgi:hypothetical protein
VSPVLGGDAPRERWQVRDARARVLARDGDASRRFITVVVGLTARAHVATLALQGEVRLADDGARVTAAAWSGFLRVPFEVDPHGRAAALALTEVVGVRIRFSE